LLLQRFDCQHIAIDAVAVVCTATPVKFVVFDHRSGGALVRVPPCAVGLFVKVTVEQNGVVFDFSLDLSQQQGSQYFILHKLSLQSFQLESLDPGLDMSAGLLEQSISFVVFVEAAGEVGDPNELLE
jgi:hypothetical protein